MTLEKILTSENVLEAIYDNLEYLFGIIPELRDMVGFEHKHPHHHLDVWEHTLYAVRLAPVDFEIRLVLLLHDIGKPHSYIEGDVRRFPNHQVVSKNMAEQILTRLNFEKSFMDEVCYLIEFHDSFITSQDIQENRELAYKRYWVQYCDAYAHHPDRLEKRVQYLNKVKTKLNNNLDNKR